LNKRADGGAIEGMASGGEKDGVAGDWNGVGLSEGEKLVDGAAEGVNIASCAVGGHKEYFLHY